MIGEINKFAVKKHDPDVMVTMDTMLAPDVKGMLEMLDEMLEPKVNSAS